MTAAPSTNAASGHCVQCGGPLAHDQRYCLRCGARRGPLPAGIAAVLGDIQTASRGPRSAAPPHPQPTADPDRLREVIPAARGGAVALLLMIAFGCLVGAATSAGGVTSLAHTIVVSFSPASRAPTTVAATGSGGSAPSAPGGGGSGAAGGGGAGAGAPAARTVTVSATTTPGGGGGGTGATPSPTTSTALPPIRHVFEIVLSGQGYQHSFGTKKGHPYLAKTLPAQGELVENYDAVATSPLANEVALVSGQGPTPQTIDDCPTFADINPARSGKLGQVRGSGCLYPASTETLGQQLQIDGLTWRAYIQGVGDAPQTTSTSTTGSTSATTTSSTTSAVTSPVSTSTAASTSTSASASTTTSSPTTTTTTTTTASTTTPQVTDTSTAASCPHPAEGAVDGAQAATAHDDYVTWKNPFVYFHSVLDATTCARDDVGLGRLATDLKQQSTTPAFSYIAPDPCDDGSDTPCRPGAKAGLGRADRFLETVVPEIERSPAYRDNGLILITFDEAPQSGPDWSTASCCSQPTYPNLKGVSTSPTTTSGTATTGAGTGTVTSATGSATTTTTSATPTTSTGPAAATTTSTATSTTGCTSPAGTSTTGTGTATSGTATSTTTTTSTATTALTTSTTPATTSPTTTGTSSAAASCTPAITGDPPGGGQVGLLLISPYVPAGKVDAFDTFNHFSLLKSVEALFGLSPLGYAADSTVPAFTSSLFTPAKP